MSYPTPQTPHATAKGAGVSRAVSIAEWFCRSLDTPGSVDEALGHRLLSLLKGYSLRLQLPSARSIREAIDSPANGTELGQGHSWWEGRHFAGGGCGRAAGAVKASIQSLSRKVTPRVGQRQGVLDSTQVPLISAYFYN